MIAIKVEHRLAVTARCPQDVRVTDVYETLIRVRRVLPVEEIHSAIEHFTYMPIYQEDLTASLAERLEADVITVGEHSGVKTTCEARG